MHTRSWLAIAGRAAVSSSSAAVLSTAVLAALGRRLVGSAAVPVNAVSHSYFGERAARHDDVSAKYTLSGYLTHHAASMFWALMFERLLARRTMKRELPIAPALATATLAAVVDYTITPQRLTPGFEKRLPLRRWSWCTQLSLSVSRSRTSNRAERAPNNPHGHFDC